MTTFEEIYEKAGAKRDVATASFRIQLEKDIAAAQVLPLGQQKKGVIEACERYEKACKPAVEQQKRDLGEF